MSSHDMAYAFEIDDDEVELSLRIKRIPTGWLVTVIHKQHDNRATAALGQVPEVDLRGLLREHREAAARAKEEKK